MNALLTAANVLIAIDYALLGGFFVSRLLATRRVHKTHRWAVVGLASMALFFFGCVHTHVDLATQADYFGHTGTWPYAASHVAQALGGLVFFIAVRWKLVVNIYDRASYERMTDAETERRLEYLAARIGLARR